MSQNQPKLSQNTIDGIAFFVENDQREEGKKLIK
jgi:hypothetical protein